MSGSNQRYKIWLEKSSDDLKWSKASLDDNIYYGACFSAQQSAEKALKAFLLFESGTYPRVHDLVSLLEECIDANDNFDELREACISLTDYYIETRYPDMSEFIEYTKESAEEAVENAKLILTFVRSKMTD